MCSHAKQRKCKTSAVLIFGSVNEKEIILREIAVIDEALAIVCARMDTDDRISDALLREVIECTENIKEAVDA